MAYVAVDRYGREEKFTCKPERYSAQENDGTWVVPYNEQVETLPEGTIEKLIGRKLTWEDEPVQLKEGE